MPRDEVWCFRWNKLSLWLGEKCVHLLQSCVYFILLKYICFWIVSFSLHLGCGLNLRQQDSWDADILKRLLEKAAVTERKGGGGNRGYVMPGGELLAFWARSHLCWRSQGESRVTVLSLMALSLFLFLSWGLNVLFYCLSPFSTLEGETDFLRCYDLCFLFFVPERREKMKLWDDFFEMFPTLWKLP